jgi:hypothetical protein
VTVIREPGEVDGPDPIGIFDRQLKVERTKSKTRVVVRKGTTPTPPIILQEYQKKRLTKFAIRK